MFSGCSAAVFGSKKQGNKKSRVIFSPCLCIIPAVVVCTVWHTLSWPIPIRSEAGAKIAAQRTLAWRRSRHPSEQTGRQTDGFCPSLAVSCPILLFMLCLLCSQHHLFPLLSGSGCCWNRKLVPSILATQPARIATYLRVVRLVHHQQLQACPVPECAAYHSPLTAVFPLQSPAFIDSRKSGTTAAGYTPLGISSRLENVAIKIIFAFFLFISESAT